MNKTRKALALLLAAALCLGMLPAAAMADGDVAEFDSTGYTTLQAAVDAVGSSGTITLLQDTEENVTIPSGTEITLDLNGCTLTNASSHTITIESGGTLTITDSTGNGTVDNVTHKCAAVYNSGTLTIEGGTFTRSAEDPKTDNGEVINTHYVIDNHGTITEISGGTFRTGDGTSAALGNCRDLIYNSGTIE
ncbi:MAG: hypothetical protein LIO57_09515, partial [Oscillospiraceae bacterium]|nr:hypothetical protein [Oscillospiraceae bacterium]